jgi:Tfp pilus assembly protein PilN
MTSPEPRKERRLTWLWVALAFFVGLVAMAGIAFLLTNIQTHKNEAIEYPLKTVQIAANELDPAVGPELPARIRLVQEHRDRRCRDALRRLQAIQQAGKVPRAQDTVGGLRVQQRLQ